MSFGSPPSHGRVEIALRIVSRAITPLAAWPLTGFALEVAPTPAPLPGKPNIVLIVADDLGYGELGLQGFRRDIPTPNIDSLAQNGVRFTQGYVSCPVCSPTRAGLMTGRYQQRFGHEFNPGPAQSASAGFGLARGEITLAERLKTLGYVTGMTGKWHLGYKSEFIPPRRGFDEFFGFLGGAHPYLPGGRAAAICRGEEPVKEEEYLTDAFGREATAFIERHHDRPFFLYLPFNAVHMPLQAADRYLARFRDIKDPQRRTFAAMMAAMDDAVGRVLAKLREHGLEERTLIFFISDNGGPTRQTTSSNGPLRGYKGQVWEGGIRVPFVVQWKGRVPGGRVDERPVISLDIHPTAVAAAGGAVSPDWKLDGVNLVPFLAGEEAGRPHDTLCWRMGTRHAIRQGDWKLLVETDQTDSALFNLAEDVGERSNLAARHLEVLETLQAAYDAWDAAMLEPEWGARGGQRRRDPAVRGSGNRAGRLRGIDDGTRRSLPLR